MLIWLLLVSPYLCIAAGSLDILAGKSLRVAHVYSLAVLSITTLIMLLSLQKWMEFAALGNIAVGGLWAYAFRRNAPNKSDARQ